MTLAVVPATGPRDLLVAAGVALPDLAEATAEVADSSIMLGELEGPRAALLTRQVLARRDYLWTRVSDLGVDIGGVVVPSLNVFAVDGPSTTVAGCFVDPHRVIAIADSAENATYETLFDVPLSAAVLRRGPALLTRYNFSFSVEPPAAIGSLEAEAGEKWAAPLDRRFARVSMRRWHAAALSAAVNRTSLSPATRLQLWVNFTRPCFAHATSSLGVQFTVAVTHPDAAAAESGTSAGARAVQQASELTGAALASVGPSMAMVAARLQSLRVHCDLASISEPPATVGNMLGLTVTLPWEPAMRADIEALDDAAAFAALLRGAGTQRNASAESNATGATLSLASRRVRADPAVLAQHAAAVLVNPFLTFIPPIVVLLLAVARAAWKRGGIPGRREVLATGQTFLWAAWFGCLFVVVPPCLQSAIIVLHFADAPATQALVSAAALGWLLLLLGPLAVIVWPPHFDAVFVPAFERDADESFFEGGVVSLATFRPFVASGEWTQRLYGQGAVVPWGAKLDDGKDPPTKPRRRAYDVAKWVRDADFNEFFAAVYNGYRAPYHYFMLPQLLLVLTAVCGSAVSRSLLPWRCLLGASLQFAAMLVQFVLVLRTHPDRYRIERRIGQFTAVVELLLVSIELANVLGAGVAVFSSMFDVGFMLLGVILTSYEVYTFVRKYASRLRRLCTGAREKEKQPAADEGQTAPLLDVPTADGELAERDGHLTEERFAALPGRKAFEEDISEATAILVRSGPEGSRCTRFRSAEEYLEWMSGRRVPTRLRYLLRRHEGSGSSDSRLVAVDDGAADVVLPVLEGTGDERRDALLPRPTHPSVLPGDWITLEAEIDYWTELLACARRAECNGGPLPLPPPEGASREPGYYTRLSMDYGFRPSLVPQVREVPEPRQLTDPGPFYGDRDALLQPVGPKHWGGTPVMPYRLSDTVVASNPLRPRLDCAQVSSAVTSSVTTDDAEALLVRNWQQQTVRAARSVDPVWACVSDAPTPAVPPDLAAELGGNMAALQAIFYHEDDYFPPPSAQSSAPRRSRNHGSASHNVRAKSSKR